MQISSKNYLSFQSCSKLQIDLISFNMQVKILKFRNQNLNFSLLSGN